MINVIQFLGTLIVQFIKYLISLTTKLCRNVAYTIKSAKFNGGNTVKKFTKEFKDDSYLPIENTFDYTVEHTYIDESSKLDLHINSLISNNLFHDQLDIAENNNFKNKSKDDMDNSSENIENIDYDHNEFFINIGTALVSKGENVKNNEFTHNISYCNVPFVMPHAKQSVYYYKNNDVIFNDTPCSNSEEVLGYSPENTYHTEKKSLLGSHTEESELQPHAYTFQDEIINEIPNINKHIPTTICSKKLLQVKYSPLVYEYPVFYSHENPNNFITSDVAAVGYTPNTTILPYQYDVDLTPGIEKIDGSGKMIHYFMGNVNIYISVLKPTNVISLHAKELNIKSITITPLSKYEQVPIVKNWSVNKNKDLLILKLSYMIDASSQWKINFKYTGLHNDNMVGFYKSVIRDSIDANVPPKYIFSTQFESVECRRAIPCWDEPFFKSKFRVRLRVPDKVVALSNMDVISDSEFEDNPVTGRRKIVDFATTPIMSTYLLAFVIGELNYLENYTSVIKNVKNSIPVKCRVYSQPKYTEKCAFALETNVKFLEFYQEFFGSSFPLKKNDSVAIPDYRSGAMENWGLITYREVLLIYDGNTLSDVTSSIKQKISITEVIAHELAHQWFGNLVTMLWWNDLWLNEGFATFCSALSMDIVYPNMQSMVKFLLNNISLGLSVDSLKSSHPINFPVDKDENIDQYFDAISYSKGASIINMIYHYLGREKFTKGVQYYIEKYKYKNTISDDIWNALDYGNNTNLNVNMNNWIDKPGFPVVIIEQELYSENEGQLTLTLSQKRFYAFMGKNNRDRDGKSDTLWWIPITILVSEDGNPTYFKTEFNTRKIKITMSCSDRPNSFWKLNTGGNGYYKVLYTSKQLDKLINIISNNKNALSVNDKAHLLIEVHTLCTSGDYNVEKILSLIDAFKNSKDTEYYVISTIWGILSTFKAYLYLRPIDTINGLKKFILSIFMPILTMLNFDPLPGEHINTSLLRLATLSALASVGELLVVGTLKSRFYAYAEGYKNALNPDIRSIAYYCVMKYTTDPQKDFDIMYAVYKNSNDPNDKLSMLASMGAINSTSLLEKLVNEYMFDENFVRLQDVGTLVGSISGINSDRKYANGLIWNYIINNWSMVYDKLYATPTLLARVVTVTIKNQVGHDIIHNVNNWLNGNDLENLPNYKTLMNERKQQLEIIRKDIVEAIETLEHNNKWVDYCAEDLEKWLKIRGYIKI